MYKKSISLIIILCILSPVLSLTAKAIDFNPNYIISDFEYLDYDSMNKSEIQFFLESKKSGLANYKTEDIDGKIKFASEIIYRAANDYKISPKFILVMLQKEQSLIETEIPTAYQLDWAMGYARCDDPVLCSPENVAEYKGFAKQADRGTWRQRFYLENSHKAWLKNANAAYEIDGTLITPVNQATANLYNYTPHLHGNRNFWKIWNRYFSKNYPDGTLLQIEGEPAVYLIANGVVRPFANRAAFSSRGYTPNKIIAAAASDLSRYNMGSPIKFPNYTLMRASNKTIYLLVNDRKHKITSPEVFKKIGYIEDEIIDLTDVELAEYETGAAITMDSVYPMGALLRDKATGGVYYVENGAKFPIWSRAILKANFSDQKIINSTKEELDKLQTGAPVKFKDGELVKGNASSAVFVISNGERRPIPSGSVFEELGYKWKNIIEIEQKNLESLYPAIGETVETRKDEDDEDEIGDGTLVMATGNPSVYLVEDSILRPILSGEVFVKLGFSWNSIKKLSQEKITAYEIGNIIDESYISSKLAAAGK